MFITFQGDYTCNSKAICDYILKNKLDYKIIWVIRSEKENDIKQFPHGIKVVSERLQMNFIMNMKEVNLYLTILLILHI